MKLFKSLLGIVAIVSLCLTTACSSTDSADGKLERFVSDKADLVIVGDLQRAIEATGSTTKDGVIKPSETLDDIFTQMGSSDREVVDRILDFKGIDWSNALFVMKIKGEKPDALLVWSVTDEEEFAKSLCDEVSDFDKEENDGYICVGNEDGAILLRDRLGILVIKGGNPCRATKAISALEAWQEEAKETPLETWKKERLAEPRIANILIAGKNFVKLAENDLSMRMALAQQPDTKKALNILAKSVCIGSFDIENNTATTELTVFDKDGKDQKIPINGTIDTSLLKYGSATDCFVGAVANTSYIAKAINSNIPTASFGAADKEAYNIIYNSFMANLDGSMMLMAGPNTTNPSEMDDAESWSFVLAATYKDNGAATALDKAAELLRNAGAEISSYTAGKSLAVRIQSGYKYNYEYDYWDDNYYTPRYVNAYAKVDGKNLVITNNNVQGSGCPVTADLLKDANAAIAFNIGKTSNIGTVLNLPFSAKGVMALSGSSFKVQLTLDGSEDGFLENLLQFAGANMR